MARYISAFAGAALAVSACLALLTGCGSDAQSAVLGQPLQAPALAGAAQPIAMSDRVYTADQSSNTVSVISPVTNTLLGTIALGNARPDDVLGALYDKQIDTHGLGFSSDGKLLAAVNVTTNSVTIIETATNTVRGTVYLKRAPHEAFFSPDGTELWVAVRGEDHVAVIDVATLKVKLEIKTTDGAAMVIFRPDGAVAFVNSSRTPELTVIDVKTHAVIKRVTGLVSAFSPNLAASPDGKEVWLTHKDVGKVTIVDAQSFAILGVVDTGPTTNHVNFVSRPEGSFAYVSVGGNNAIKVYARNGGTPTLVDTIATGADPHGLWPSPDNSRVYVGLENQDAVQVVDTATRTVIATLKIGQMPQALVYVANAVPAGDGMAGLTKQNVGLRITSTSAAVAGGGEADIVVRELQGVDSINVEAKGLVAGTTYQVIALGAAGTQQVIADFKAGPDGNGKANPMIKFFDAGLTGVRVAAAS